MSGYVSDEEFDKAAGERARAFSAWMNKQERLGIWLIRAGMGWSLGLIVVALLLPGAHWLLYVSSLPVTAAIVANGVLFRRVKRRIDAHYSVETTLSDLHYGNKLRQLRAPEADGEAW